jgi:threonine 3-dehydrogenase
VVFGVCHPCRTGNGHVCDKTKIIGDMNGAWADYLHSRRQLLPLSDDRPRIGTILEPYGNAVHTAFQVSPPGTSWVTGCGPSAFFSVAVPYAGAARVFATDVIDFKLGHARKLGADEVFHMERRRRRRASGAPQRWQRTRS